VPASIARATIVKYRHWAGVDVDVYQVPVPEEMQPPPQNAPAPRRFAGAVAIGNEFGVHFAAIQPSTEIR
jgi:hypothetical protein